MQSKTDTTSMQHRFMAYHYSEGTSRESKKKFLFLNLKSMHSFFESMHFNMKCLKSLPVQSVVDQMPVCDI